MSQTTTIQNLRAPSEANLPSVAPGFGSLQSFELMQRAANLLASSTLVPAQYRKVIEKLDRYGNVKESRENPNALANAVVALNMAQRMGADPLMVMQNLYIVEGRPSWSSQWIIAAVNGCGRFSPLRFDIKVLGPKCIDYKSTYWEAGERRSKVEKVEIVDKVCVAWAIEKETGERLESPAVSIEMAVLEGWYTKNGSKWQTMDEVMLRYRTASFFGKLYAPELLMGLQTVEEAQDIIEATTGPDGTISVNVDELRASAAPTQRQSSASATNVTDVEARPTSAATDAQNTTDTAPAAEPVDDARADDQHQRADLPGTDPSGDDLGLDPAKVQAQLMSATTIDVLDVASDSIDGVLDLGERARLHQLYQQRRLSMTAAAQRAPTQRRRVQAPE